MELDKTKKLGKCRLCGHTRELCESHIMPDFCYKPLRDDKGRLTQLSHTNNQDACFRLRGKGICELLLCRECETRFSRFESHAAKLFNGSPPPFVSRSQRTREYPALDYQKIKLFFLSLLWRASVSRHEFFSHVSLGSRHEAIIRDRLLREDPGQAGDYLTLIFRLNYRGEHLLELMTEPTPVMHEQRKCYRFVMSGFVAIMSVTSMPPTKECLSLAISPAAPVRTHDTELEELEFLRAVPARIFAATPA